jgi:hypothetical protein
VPVAIGGEAHGGVVPGVDAGLKAEVRQRAAFRCEYRHFPEQFAELRFQLGHIIPEQDRGPTVLRNVAWSCLRCNKRKGPNLSGMDPQTSRMVRLFNPRDDVWRDHFTWHGPRLIGLTPIGRATVAVLQCNHPDAMLAREALMAEGVDFA